MKESQTHLQIYTFIIFKNIDNYRWKINDLVMFLDSIVNNAAFLQQREKNFYGITIDLIKNEKYSISICFL